MPALAGAHRPAQLVLWLALFRIAPSAVVSRAGVPVQHQGLVAGLGKQGLQDAVPFLIVITLFILGRSIPMRGEDTRSNLPPVILPRTDPS